MSPVAPGTAYPQEMHDRVAVLLRAGHSNKDIITATGVGAPFISEVGKEIGLFRGPGGRLITEAKAKDISGKVGRVLLDEVASEEVVLLATEGATPQELAKQFGVTEETIRHRLRKAGFTPTGPGRRLVPPAPKTNGAATTPRAQLVLDEPQKVTLLRNLAKQGIKKRYVSLGALYQDSHKWSELRFDMHELAKALFDLRAHGYVTFQQNAATGSGKMKGIRVTSAGEQFIRQLDSKTKPQNQKPEPVNGYAHPVGDVEAEPVAAPEPERAEVEPAVGSGAGSPPVAPVAVPAPSPAQWPLLAALRARVASTAKAKAKAERYLAAAALLEDDEDKADQLMVDALVGAATELAAMASLTSLEAEYLQFAEAAETAVG